MRIVLITSSASALGLEGPAAAADEPGRQNGYYMKEALFSAIYLCPCVAVWMQRCCFQRAKAICFHPRGEHLPFWTVTEKSSTLAAVSIVCVYSFSRNAVS
jgi:hypothetical protein